MRQLPGITIAPDERPDRDEIIQSSQKYKQMKLTSNQVIIAFLV